MAKLKDLSQLIRSKNAGPFSLTFDFMFDCLENYKRVRDSGVINKDYFHHMFGSHMDDIEVFAIDAAQGIKVTIPRPITQGDLEDSDSYGCQFFAPMIDIEVP